MQRAIVLMASVMLYAVSWAADNPQPLAQYCMVGGGTHDMRPCAQPSNEHIVNATQVVKGDVNFCSRYLRDQYQGINLSLQHSVTQMEAREYVRSIVGGDGSGDVHPSAAVIDLNNDGVPERVTWISMYSGAGRGCDVEFYVEIDGTGKLRNGGLSSVLKPSRCGDRFRAIRYQGIVYLEKRTKAESVEGYVDVTEELRRIQQGRSRLVCKFGFVWDLIPRQPSGRPQTHEEPPELLNVFK